MWWPENKDRFTAYLTNDEPPELGSVPTEQGSMRQED